jgi:hypothetical protein
MVKTSAATVVLLASAAAGVCAVGVGSQAASAATIAVKPHIPAEPPPDCNTIYLSAVTYSGSKYEFKIVGTDLTPWLGKTGLGVMAWQAGVVGQGSPFESGDVNATGSGGARTATITLSPVKSGQTLDIDAEIRYSLNGSDLCLSQFFPVAGEDAAMAPPKEAMAQAVRAKDPALSVRPDSASGCTQNGICINVDGSGLYVSSVGGGVAPNGGYVSPRTWCGDVYAEDKSGSNIYYTSDPVPGCASSSGSPLAASWNPDRNFPNGSQICLYANKTSGNYNAGGPACETIQS